MTSPAISWSEEYWTWYKDHLDLSWDFLAGAPGNFPKLMDQVLVLDPAAIDHDDEAAWAVLSSFEQGLRHLLRLARRRATGRVRKPDYAGLLALVKIFRQRIAARSALNDFLSAELRRMDGVCLDPAEQVVNAAIAWEKAGTTFDGMQQRDIDGTGLVMVVAQAAYMSGDLVHVSAALTLDPKVGLALFYDPAANADRDIKTALLKFYDGGPKGLHPRIALIPTTDCEAAYRKSIDGFFPKSLFPFGRPAILNATGCCVPIGTATQKIADYYRLDPGGCQAKLAAEWLPAGWENGNICSPTGKQMLAQWVSSRFTPDTKYALLWFRRSGAKGGAHPENDTSATATKALLEMIQAPNLYPGSAVVIVGDDGHNLAAKVKPLHNLTLYWNQENSPFHGGDRRYQLALFAYLKRKGIKFVNIGMKSGGLDGPALLGGDTIYMEELYNYQEGRMEKWVGVVPGYTRIALGHAPTRSGKRALHQLILMNHDRGTTELGEAVAELRKSPVLAELTAEDLVQIVSQCARQAGKDWAGINPAAGLFDPVPVNIAFTGVCKALEAALKLKSGDLKPKFAGDWGIFRMWSITAIRADQVRGKAEVKMRICNAYNGPSEGLSAPDQDKLFEAVNVFFEAGWSKAKKL